jgi:two-component system, cell cycle sensor histidine kinase and response regulator CckA
VPRQTILVVDDEETICEIVSRLLQTEGYLCVTAYSGEAALEWLRTNTPWPDLFILDVRLPGMSGPEFLLETLRMRQGTPVLYVSGYPKHMLEKGQDFSRSVEFLPKPFTTEQLVRSVQRLLSVPSSPPPPDSPDLTQIPRAS